jgi:hypothetical protein
MKTTLEIPDAIFRQAKAKAAERGIPLRQLVSEAVAQSLRVNSNSQEKPWAALGGRLQHLRKETARVNKLIEQEFEKIEP